MNVRLHIHHSVLRRLTGRNAQSGQVIILMAFGMIALLAVLGLAIDGGRLYFLERDAQNASDAAVMAATFALCTNSDPEPPALSAASDNGFFTDGSTMTVEVNQPPLYRPIDEPDPDKLMDYAEVVISAEIPSYFIHLVYGGDLAVTTHAIGHCVRGWDPWNDGRALVATHGCETNCKNPISATGSDLDVIGGAISNGGIRFNPSGSEAACTDPLDLDHCVGVIGDVSYYTDGVCTAEKEEYLSSPTPLPEPFEIPELYHIEDYDTGGVHATAAIADGNRYANYTGDLSINIKTRGGHQMPGTTEVITIRQWFARGGLLFVDGNITIDFDGPVGHLTIVSTGEISVKDFEGMLSYTSDHLLLFTTAASGCNTSVIKSTGGTAGWDGVIYAPNGRVEVPGSRATATGAVIADTIVIPGSHLDIIYRPEYLPATPSSIEVVE